MIDRKPNIMTIIPKFLATGIGSMPFGDPEYAVDVSLSKVKEAPFWPQLPKLNLYEQMEIQYSEGIPCVVTDHENRRMYLQTSEDYSETFAQFYEEYMKAMDPDTGNGDCSAMAIGPEYSKGLYVFEKRLREKNERLPFIKVQTIGPCSFSLTTVDENKRAIYYNEEFRDIITKVLSMKCRWQIQKFQKFADNTICFIDEPILSAFGSSTYVTVKREDVIALIREVIDAIHADNALAGVHCCGNTDWSLITEAGADIINFDAFEYGETIAMYAKAVKEHLEKRGAIAWGIVPTSTAIRDVTVEGLVDLLESRMDNLASKGIDKQLIAEQAIITPACGTGSMDPTDAKKVFEMNAALSVAIKEKYGF